MTTSSRWWIAAFVVAVFLGGAGAGVIVDRIWLLDRRPPPAGAVSVLDGRRPRGDRATGRVVDVNLARLRNRLALTTAQQEAARELIEAWVSRVLDLQGRTRDQLLSETQRFEEQLSSLLTPEQRERLTDVRTVLLVPTGRGRLTGPVEGGRGGFRGGPGRPGGPGRE
jgi:hypothetical protein